MCDFEIQYALIIPAFNEAGSLKEIFSKLQEIVVLRKDLEIILIDNGSTDATSHLFTIFRSANEEPRLKLLTKQSNTGYGAGLKYGFSNSSAPYLIWTHADLQCDLWDVIRAITKHEVEGCGPFDIVKGMRWRRSILDRTISFLLGTINRLVNFIAIDDINAQPNLVSRITLQKIELNFLTKALRSGHRIFRFPVLFLDRKHGTGSNDGFNRKFAFSVTCIKSILNLRKNRADY
jgi:glycosyltransferase involved in cell wall biosynthesis